MEIENLLENEIWFLINKISFVLKLISIYYIDMPENGKEEPSTFIIFVVFDAYCQNHNLCKMKQ